MERRGAIYPLVTVLGMLSIEKIFTDLALECDILCRLKNQNKIIIPFDKEQYNTWSNFKRYRRIATRYRRKISCRYTSRLHSYPPSLIIQQTIKSRQLGGIFF